MYQIFFIIMIAGQVFSHPLDSKSNKLQETVATQQNNGNQHRVLRSVHGSNIVAEERLFNNIFAKIRTRRSSAEECEKLSLCKLHAHSQHSFIDTFELYFVNKENAQLWDHRSHTAADCERMFAGCSGETESKRANSAPARAQPRQFRADYSDEDDY